MSNLTDKQKRFCEEYVIDNNATQAAIRSGYSENSAGQIGEQNLKKLEIQSYISELQKNKARELNITFEDVVNGVWQIAQKGERDSDRLKAFDQVSKMLGFYEKDNSQKQSVTNISLKDMVSFNDKSTPEI